MATRVVADDGLPAEQVGAWAKDKHAYLCRYLDASRSARKKYVGPGNAGATFVDLFCSFGRSKIRDTGEFVDGSPVAAWKASSGGPAPFSKVHIADVDADAVNTCKRRLEHLGAPVIVHVGDAVSAAREYVTHVSRSGLHLAFLDPYGIGQLDFRIIKELARLQRIDMLIHVSAMDLQRNLSGQISDQDAQEFETFAPGWRGNVELTGSQSDIRARLLAYWSRLVEGLGMRPFSDSRLIQATRGQRLYWLMLASRSDLAQDLWRKIGSANRQTALEL